MRKVFWCCTAAAAAFAGVFHWAAGYTSRHPDSLVGRCMITAYTLGITYNPIYRVTTAVVNKVAGSTAQTAASVDTAVVDEDVTQEMEFVEPQGEVIEAVPMRLPGQIIIHEDEEPCGILPLLDVPVPVPPANAVDYQVQVQEARTGSVLFGTTVNSDAGGGVKVYTVPVIDNVQEYAVPVIDNVPAYMPPAQDDEVTGPMTYAEDAQEVKTDQSLFEWLWSLFQAQTGYDSNGIGDRLDGNVEGSTEESGADQPGKLPNLQQDPNYHHHYPGCPYTGHCPYTGRYANPVMQPAQTPTIEEIRKIKKKPEPIPMPQTEESSIDDTLPLKMKSLKSWWRKLTCPDADECPKHPEVDTTEFRRSDAKPYDFAPIPF